MERYRSRRNCTGRSGFLALAILAIFTMLASIPRPSTAQGSALRFFGNGDNDIDRVKIRLDDPDTVEPGLPADVGDTDFTIEFWMRALAGENPAAAIACGENNNWINGNIVIDHDRFNQDRAWGLSIGNRRLAWGMLATSEFGNFERGETICGTTIVDDDTWHHVAIDRRRSDGRMRIWVDGQMDAEGDGPEGDVSYPDDGVPGPFCSGPCVNSDPFLVLAAEKHDADPSQFPSFSGWLDEMMISETLRYTTPFTRPTAPFVPDALTVALYHFDEGSGDVVSDSSNAPGGPSPGERRFGGNPAGPQWVASDAPISSGQTPPEAPSELTVDGS